MSQSERRAPDCARNLPNNNLEFVLIRFSCALSIIVCHSLSVSCFCHSACAHSIACLVGTHATMRITVMVTVTDSRARSRSRTIYEYLLIHLNPNFVRILCVRRKPEPNAHECACASWHLYVTSHACNDLLHSTFHADWVCHRHGVWASVCHSHGVWASCSCVFSHISFGHVIVVCQLAKWFRSHACRSCAKHRSRSRSRSRTGVSYVAHSWTH